ncbi:hypothetical protein DPMN_161812 [Dreissena polymorpha]|uniref:Uncharacterized protein n=1 Tax=Dreissena polymorpha TaxID=45954 RepID=A0A9D4IT17_DREPO|nr:hypothetical protein DPMN_161812 [Dreissena polymorpha]
MMFSLINIIATRYPPVLPAIDSPYVCTHKSSEHSRRTTFGCNARHEKGTKGFFGFQDQDIQSVTGLDNRRLFLSC